MHESLATAALAVHLLLVNLAMSAPLLALGLEIRQSRTGDAVAGRLARRLVSAAQWSLLAAIGLGGILAFVVWREPSPSYFRAVEVFPRSRLWFGAGELLFYFVCLGAYGALWERLRRHRWLHRLLAVAAVTNLWYHFPPLFTMLAQIASRPELQAAPLDRQAVYHLLTSGAVLSRVAHVWIASLAVGGLYLAYLAAAGDESEMAPNAGSGEKQPGEPSGLAPAHARLAIFGGRMALVATLAQLPVGLWVLLELPESARDALFGGKLWLASALVLSLAAVIRLLHQLAAIALGEVSRPWFSRAAISRVWLIPSHRRLSRHR